MSKARDVRDLLVPPKKPLSKAITTVASKRHIAAGKGPNKTIGAKTRKPIALKLAGKLT